jgi:chaperonin cofactor prefoldin
VENIKQLKDNPSLFKNLSTGAVINTDKEGYKSALIRKKKNKEIKSLKKELEQLKDRVSVLEKHILSDINNN